MHARAVIISELPLPLPDYHISVTDEARGKNILAWQKKCRMDKACRWNI